MIHYFLNVEDRTGEAGSAGGQQFHFFQACTGGSYISIIFYNIGRVHLLKVAVSIITARYAMGFQEISHLPVFPELH